MSNGNIRYAFGFKIKLHMDHVDLLKTIQDTLGIGWLENPKNNTCSYHVNSERELRHLIDRPLSGTIPSWLRHPPSTPCQWREGSKREGDLLDNTTLMGIKYLDYISFKEAFFLYFNRTGLVTETLQVEIEKIRANHNTKRTIFNMPEGFKRIITDYKLLGLIEGDGSFFIQKAGLTPRFELELTSSQKPLLVAIRAYLNSKLGLSCIKDQISSTIEASPKKGGIKIRDMKAKSNSKPRVRLEIIGVDLLHNYFNVFLKDLKFFSSPPGDPSGTGSRQGSKGKDFEVFVTHVDKLLGLKLIDTCQDEKIQNIPEDIQKLFADRTVARNEKNWVEADRLRDEIKNAGFEVID